MGTGHYTAARVQAGAPGASTLAGAEQNRHHGELRDLWQCRRWAVNDGAAYGPVSAGSTSDYSVGGVYTLPLGELVSGDYHIYAIQWPADSVVFSVDGALYHTVTPSNTEPGKHRAGQPGYAVRDNLADNTYQGWQLLDSTRQPSITTSLQSPALAA